jgi:hypothetical protein
MTYLGLRPDQVSSANGYYSEFPDPRALLGMRCPDAAHGAALSGPLAWAGQAGPESGLQLIRR